MARVQVLAGVGATNLESDARANEGGQGPGLGLGHVKGGSASEPIIL